MGCCSKDIVRQARVAFGAVERANNLVCNLVAEIHEPTPFFDAPEFQIAGMIISLAIRTRCYSHARMPLSFDCPALVEFSGCDQAGYCYPLAVFLKFFRLALFEKCVKRRLGYTPALPCQHIT